MRKKARPLTEWEKRFIRRAAGIAKHTTVTAIGKRIGRSQPITGRLIIGEKLRSRKETKKIANEALRKKYHPAHDQKQKIIELLREKKRNRNRTFQEIAIKCNVSPAFVARVNEKERIFSSEEIRNLRGKRSRKPEIVKRYNEARKMIKNTNMNFYQIAEKMGAKEAFVSKANKGWGKDKQLRSRKEILEIAYDLKPTNLFSDKQKLELIEKLKPWLKSKLWKRSVPARDHQRIIDFVSKKLFRRLNYFDQERNVPVEGFMRADSPYHIMQAIMHRSKEVSLRAIEDKQGRLTKPSAREKPPNEIAITRDIVEKVGKILSRKEKAVLSARMKGIKHKKIGQKLGFSKERSRQIEVKAKEKLRRYFKVSNKR